jgi:DNA primase small subunit
MNAFYRRLFPYRPFFLWLNQDHGQSQSFRRGLPPTEY